MLSAECGLSMTGMALAEVDDLRCKVGSSAPEAKQPPQPMAPDTSAKVAPVTSARVAPVTSAKME